MKTPNPTDPATLSDLARQTDRIVDDKIARICRAEYARANTLPDGSPRHRFKPYSLPAIVETLIGMRSECADPATGAERLEGIAAFATTGETRERAFSRN